MTTGRPDSRLGTDLGPYRIERVLGRGGMGVVYLAEQRELGRNVALKLLPDELASDADFRARFERESRLAAAIDHPNIIPLYEAGEIEGVLFLAMRFVDGTDLATRLEAGPPSPSTSIEILAQVAGALDAAHARGLVHRDVKPGNVMLDSSAGEGREHAYLTDFGLTKQAGSESGLTRAGAFLGTPAYMAPEQIDGFEVDGQADQYSLACMAFECLTGQVPFKREKEISVAMAHLKDAPPSAVALRPELPPAVDTVLAQGMAKDRGARYPTCDAFIADLRAALGGDAILARPTRAERRRRGPLLVAAALGLGLVAVAGLALASGLLGKGSGSPSPSESVAAVAPTVAPSPKVSPTPDPSIYPNVTESEVLASLPSDLAATCQRGQGKADTATAGFNGRIASFRTGVPPNVVVHYETVQPPAPKASLMCAPSGGPDRVYFQRIVSGNGISETANAVTQIASRYGIKGGDCASGTDAYTTWSLGGGDIASGSVTCIAKAEWDGASWIYWSFADGKILAFATRKDAGHDALYSWWKKLTLFLK